MKSYVYDQLYNLFNMFETFHDKSPNESTQNGQ